MPYRWLLFDADMTLFDYHAAERHALSRSLLEAGLPSDDGCLAAYRAINAALWRDFAAGILAQEDLRTLRFDRLFSLMSVSFDAGTFSDLYLHHLSGAHYLMPGAHSTLADLVERYNMAIVTNGIKQVQVSRLSLSSINQYISHITVSEDAGFPKPHAAIFDLAFTRMENPAKEQVLMIGDDHQVDILGGHNYGIDTCLIAEDDPDSDPRPTYRITSLDQLPVLLAGLS
jgi:2-haloacid dehalogenase